VDSKSNTARTPLSYTAEEGYEAVIKLLLENHIDMDSKFNIGRTPLSYAAENGHEAIVKLLLENPVDIDSKSNIDRTPLSYATENGHQAVVMLLSSKNKVFIEAWSSFKHYIFDANTLFSSFLLIIIV
jgi:ankyrin repeat protein